MNEKLNDDPIEQNLPWLTPWFTHPNRSLLDLSAEEEHVLDEISTHWTTTDKVTLFNSLGERFGRDLVGCVIDKVVAAHIHQEWEIVGREQPSRGIDDLVRLLWEPLPSQGFDISIEKQPDGVQIHCTLCPHADLGKRINGSEWLYHLVCSGDPPMTAGFNPNIGFRRTQTLMQGQSCCDHFYFMIE